MLSKTEDDPRGRPGLDSQKWYPVGLAAAWMSISPNELREKIDAGEIDHRVFDGEPWLKRSTVAENMNEG